MSLSYVGSTTPHEVAYDFEILPQKTVSTLTSFMVHEETVLSQGIQKATAIYLLEEIANRPGTLRVTQFSQVNSEDEGRNKLKRLISLRTMLGLIDRKGRPVGNLAEITEKAKEMASDDIDVVTEEDDSFDDDNGMESVKGEIEPTEDGAAPLMIEEATNIDEKF